MKEWRIPVTWEMFGVVTVCADTLENAIHKVNFDDDIGLPNDRFYVDGSFGSTYDECQIDEVREMYNNGRPD